MYHPEVVDRLAILTRPIRASSTRAAPPQPARAVLVLLLLRAAGPARASRAREDWEFFQHFLRDAQPPYTKEEIDRYIEAWAQEGAAGAMIDYYRAAVRPPKGTKTELQPISAPTLVIWGEKDRYLGPDLAEPHHEDVPNLDRVERLPDASHWVHHDEAERVNQLLVDFFAPARTTSGRNAQAAVCQQKSQNSYAARSGLCPAPVQVFPAERMQMGLSRGAAAASGPCSVIFLLDLLVRPAAFSTVTVTRARILRLSFTIRNVFRVSLILSVTLPVAGTVKDFFVSVTFFLRF